MFHAKDNWYFDRDGYGSVHVMRGLTDGYTGKPFKADVVVFEAGLWASIVASVSAQGEESGRFYEALAFHNTLPEPKTNPLEGIKIHTDVWEMFYEIKEYTNNHPGVIFPADLPAELMFGFVHDDGTYWAIKIYDLKTTINNNPNERFQNMLRASIKTAEGKHNLCASLSNPPESKNGS